MKAYRNRNWIAGRIAALWACLLLFSCNNDEILETGNKGDGCGNICFGVSSGESVQTRGGTAAGKDGYTAGRFVLRADKSDDTLCVRTVVYDGTDKGDDTNYTEERELLAHRDVNPDYTYQKERNCREDDERIDH